MQIPLKDWLSIRQKLLRLIHQWHGPIMMQRRASNTPDQHFSPVIRLRVELECSQTGNLQLNGDIRPSEGKVPQLEVTRRRRGEPLFESAACQIFHPVGATFCSASEILHDFVVKKLRGGIGELVGEVGTNEAEVGVAGGTLNICIGVTEG